MAARYQKYRLKWPLTPSQVINIDDMFEQIFKDLANNSLSVVPAQITGVIGVANGGTGISSYTIGDLLYASAATTLSKLADVATGNALLSGGVGASPAWGKITLTGHVSGILPIANGGTNSNVALSGSTLMISNGSAIVQGAAGTTTTVLHGNPAGAPTFGAVIEADISLSNNTTNDATTSRHGFLPILSNNASQFLNGQGNFAIPSGVTNSYLTQAFVGQTSVNVVHNFGTYPVVQVIDNTGAVLVPLTTVNNTVNDFTVTFAVATTGTIIATVGSPQPQSVIAVNANYTTLATDQIIEVTASPVTITLLTAIGNTGRKQVIDNAAGGDILCNTTAAQTIDGSLVQTIPPNNSMTVYSDGANWRII